MAYKISVTTRITVTGDTAEETREVYRWTMGTPPEAASRVSDAWELAQRGPRPAALPSPEDSQQPPDDEPTPQVAPSDNSGGGERRYLALQEAINVYLTAAAAGGLAAKTVELYRFVLGALRDKFSPECDIRSIDERAVSAHLESLRERGLSTGYLHTRGQILKTFFNWQVRQHNIETSPMAGIRLRIPHSKQVAPFSDDEIHRLLEAATKPLEWAVVTLLLDTGMRSSELTSLKLAQVDLEQNLIHVDGKGGKLRILALNDRPRRALEVYLASRPQRGGLIWPEGWHRKHVSYIVGRIAKKARVTGVFPHRFRHTFASRFLQQTGDAMALQALMGHSSLTMVQHYIRAAQADIAVDVHKQHSLLSALAQDKCQA